MASNRIGRINEEIYGAEFRFETPKGSCKLNVPKKEQLGESFIDDFLDYGVKELDSESNRNRTLRSTGKSAKLTKQTVNQ